MCEANMYLCIYVFKYRHIGILTLQRNYIFLLKSVLGMIVAVCRNIFIENVLSQCKMRK